ncbi:MAG TPA: hypothetical protein VJ508_07635, partial [Saprospiraceae bacterium]|nr:hypothetical protein [Saprospiraceae bacterium]
MRLRSTSILVISVFSLLLVSGFYLLKEKTRFVSLPEPAKEEREEKKEADRLGPNELFFLDRNYPADHVNAATYHKMMKRSMTYDKTHASRRDLDKPWTLQGPGNIGGRVNAIAVNPINPDIMLIGYAQGGVYRTEDNGQNWIPVFDDQPSLAISDIQFERNNPDHVWVSTGDVNISGYPFLGSGIFKSEDGGQTFHSQGLEDLGILSKIAIDQNPQYIYVGS